jgi:ssDNA-binding Zn-finger/Zn-ribbon topoisomerase 1
LTCRIAFNRGTDIKTPAKTKCPECGNEMVSVNHKFQPPKKSDIKKWEVVNFLVNHGFRYDHVYEQIDIGTYQQQGRYPENMRDAKEFVKNFDTNGIKIKKPAANNR